MITEWVLSNFKSIGQLTRLPLAPVTIFVGPNSSGKSTILQSILTVAQTITAPPSKRSIVLNGDLVRMGFVEDVAHEGMEQALLEIGFTIQPIGATNSTAELGDNYSQPIMATTKYVRKDDPNQQGSTFALSQAHFSQGDGLRLRFHRVEGQEAAADYVRQLPLRKILPELKKEIEKGQFDYLVDEYLPRRERVSDQERSYVSVDHFLPERVLELFNESEETLHSALDSVANFFSGRIRDVRIESVKSVGITRKGGEATRTFIAHAVERAASHMKGERTLQELRLAEAFIDRYESLDEWAIAVKGQFPRTARELAFGIKTLLNRAAVESKGVQADELGIRSTTLPYRLDQMVKAVETYFTSHIRYLGPLREDPRSVYGIPNIPEMKDLGLKGEYTAAILDHYQELEVDYPAPNAKGPRRAGLAQAVSDWLNRMGLVDHIETRDRGKLGTELAVHSPGVSKNLDLTNVGFGVSQVLPTLVLGLLAPPNSTLMFEQPELHLHPKVQSIIGDFFLGLAGMGKQCLVETHSEYLVNRLRRRMAESVDDSVARMARIYFVERHAGVSQFKSVALNEFGSVLEWPEGFFDEGPNEAQQIMQAALEKRKRYPQKGS